MINKLLNKEITQEELLNYYNANISYMWLPKFVNGFIFNYKNINNIVINNNISAYKQKRAILHELAHLELSHIDKRKALLEFSIEGLEDEADKYINFLGGNRWIL